MKTLSQGIDWESDAAREMNGAELVSGGAAFEEDAIVVGDEPREPVACASY